MPRIKFRDFMGGLHLTSAKDAQPANTVRRARNIEFRQGRVRAAVPSKQLAGTEGTPGFGTLLNFFNFNDGAGTYRLWARGKQVTERLKRFDGAVWNDLTLPLGISLTENFQLTWIIATPTPEQPEFLFMVDQGGGTGFPAGTYPNIGHLFKGTGAGILTRWGILPPTSTMVTDITSAVATQDEKFVNTVAVDPLESAADWTLASADEDGLGAFTAIDTIANPSISGNSIRFRIEKDDSAQMTRGFASNIDLTTYGATPSPDEDYIQFYIRVRRPSRIENVEVAFDTTAAGDFKSDFFSRELTFKLVKRRKKKQLIGLGDLVPLRNTQKFLAENQAEMKDLTFTEEQGTQTVFVAKNTWTRVTLPKNSFERSGTPSWATVRAIRFTVHANKQGRTAVFFDRLTLNGGVGMQGDYKYTITFRRSDTLTRSNPFITTDGVITAENVSNVERQGVNLTLPAMAFDPQADRLELWRTIGNGAAYFKAGQIALTVPGTVVAGTVILDKTADYIGLNGGATTPYTTVTASGVYTGNPILDPTEELPLDNTSPNDPDFGFQDAAGPHVGRMWWTRNARPTKASIALAEDATGLVYYSPVGRMEAVDAFIAITAGRTDPVQKIIVWNDRLFAFTKQGLYEILGADEPFISHKVEGAPGVIFPNTVVGCVQGIFWAVPGDGIYRFNGQYAENISDKDLQPVMKSNEGDADEGTTGDQASTFRVAAAGKNAIWFTGLPPTGAGPQYSYVFDFDRLTWRWREISRWLWFDYVNNRMLEEHSETIHDAEPITFPVAGATPQFLELATPTARAGPGQKGVLRHLFIEYNPATEGALVVSIRVDEVTTSLGALTVTAGRRGQEYTLNRPGERFSVLIIGSTTQNPVEIYGIELDIYVPPMTEPDSGVSGH